MGQASSVDAAAFSSAMQEGQTAAIAQALTRDPSLASSDIDKGGAKAWHIVATQGLLPILQVMVEAMTSILQRSHQFKMSQLDLLRELSGLLNLRNLAGQTPLMLACDAKHLSVVKYLLEYGANPWLQDSLGQRTCLHYAASTDGAAVAQAVLDFVSQNMGQMRTLHGAYTMHRLADMASATGFTPLHYAVWHSQGDVITVLTSHGAHLCAQNTATFSGSSLTTPLHIAAMRGNVRMAKALLRAYVDRIDDHTSAPLCTNTGDPAASAGRPTATDPRTARNRAGSTPLHVAIEHEHRGEALLNALQPWTHLGVIFADEHPDLRCVGPRRLLEVAVAAAQPLLLAQVAEVVAALAAPPPTQVPEEQLEASPFLTAAPDVSMLSFSASLPFPPLPVLLPPPLVALSTAFASTLATSGGRCFGGGRRVAGACPANHQPTSGGRRAGRARRRPGQGARDRHQPLGWVHGPGSGPDRRLW